MKPLGIQHVRAIRLAASQSWISGSSCNWSDVDQKEVPWLSGLPRSQAARQLSSSRLRTWGWILDRLPTLPGCWLSGESRCLLGRRRPGEIREAAWNCAESFITPLTSCKPHFSCIYYRTDHYYTGYLWKWDILAVFHKYAWTWLLLCCYCFYLVRIKNLHMTIYLYYLPLRENINANCHWLAPLLSDFWVGWTTAEKIRI